MGARRGVMMILAMTLLMRYNIICALEGCSEIPDDWDHSIAEIAQYPSHQSDQCIDHSATDRVTEVTVNTPLAYLKIVSDDQLIQVMIILVILCAVFMQYHTS